MKNNKITTIIEALEKISMQTETPLLGLIAPLTGYAWSEEDAGEMRRYKDGEEEGICNDPDSESGFDFGGKEGEG